MQYLIQKPKALKFPILQHQPKTNQHHAGWLHELQRGDEATPLEVRAGHLLSQAWDVGFGTQTSDFVMNSRLETTGCEA